MQNKITENSELEAGKYYHCFTKGAQRHSIELCQEGLNAPKFLGQRIWADDDNNQALDRWDIYGPIEVPNVMSGS